MVQPNKKCLRKEVRTRKKKVENITGAVTGTFEDLVYSCTLDLYSSTSQGRFLNRLHKLQNTWTSTLLKVQNYKTVHHLTEQPTLRHQQLLCRRTLHNSFLYQRTVCPFLALILCKANSAFCTKKHSVFMVCSCMIFSINCSCQLIFLSNQSFLEFRPILLDPLGM